MPKQPYISPSLSTLVVQSVPWGPQPYVWVASLRVQQRVVTTWCILCQAWPWSHLLENQGHQGGVWCPGPVLAFQQIALGGLYQGRT